PSPLEENLRRLTDEVGGRVTGSPQMAKAVAWGVAAFRAAGIEVHTEKYTLPITWSEGKTQLLMTGPFLAESESGGMGRGSRGVPLRAVSEAWGPATPAQGIEAAVIDVGD